MSVPIKRVVIENSIIIHHGHELKLSLSICPNP